MAPPLICKYKYPNIVSMWNTNFDFISNTEDIEISFKTLIDIIDIIIKENKKLKYQISLFKKAFKHPKHVNSMLIKLHNG